MPYFIAGHPGSDLTAMIDLALYLKRHGLKPDKVQDFIPGPMDIATCMYYTGLGSDDRRAGLRAQGRRDADCNRRCCNTSSRKTTPTCARRCSKPTGSIWSATARNV